MDVIAALGIIPIGEGHPGAGFPQITGDGRDEAAEGFAVLSHGGDPDLPIGFGVIRPGIQGNAVNIHPGQIAFRFLPIEFLGKQAQAQRPIPGQVIFQAPALAGEGEAGALRAGGPLHPAGGHGLRLLFPGPGRFFLAQAAQDAGVAGDPHHRLGGQIDISGQVPREIVGAKLIAGVVPVSIQIAHPALQQRPVLLQQPRVRPKADGAFQHNQHVAAFLHRHLIANVVNIRPGGIGIQRGVHNAVAGAMAIGVYLACGVGIAAHVVGGEILRPDGHLRKFQHGAAQGVHQLGAIGQEQRYGGIAYIHGADAAVGIVFLGEQRHFPLGSGDELMGGDALPPGSRGDAGVILAADGLGLGENIRVQGLAAAQKSVVFPGEAAQCVRNLRALPGIPGPAGDAEIIDGGDILIAQQRKGALRGGKPRFPGEFQPAFRGGNPARRGGQIQIAPVDSDVIARMAQHPLLLLAHIGRAQAAGLVSVGVHGRGHLAFVAQAGGSDELKRRFVGRAVQAFQAEIHHGNGGGKHVQIIGQQRRTEGNGEPHPGGLHYGLGLGGGDAKINGLHGGIRAVAQEKEAPSVDDQMAGQGLFLPRPVDGFGGGKRVARHPDGKIGVVGNQRQRGQTIKLLHA